MGPRSAPTSALGLELAAVRLSALYRDHAREILGYALRRCADPEDAADALAETFLVAWRRRSEIPAGGEARLWLYGTARRVLANQRRGERRREQLAERMRHELRRQLPAQLSHEEGGELFRALAALAEADRELLLLIGWEGLAPSEAARVLGISSLAARSRLHRARRHLRAHLPQGPAQSSPRTTEMRAEEAG
jgi:RNA polymerase sigma-70 factor (ECF subfamily)